ncbi:MAG: hypothetical protein HN341_04975 [Verrucomicrobia bacterium]|jgi:hypothetical protein|nr:hypothetical protein [Verrucomicrobiota bacterium]
MKQLTRSMALASALAVIAGAAIGATTLPYSTNFTDTAGTALADPWTGAGGTAQIVADAGADGSASSASVSDGITLGVSGAPANVWFQTYAKLTEFGTQPDDFATTPDATTVAAFYLYDGNLYANHDTAWVNLGAVAADTWKGIAVHLDHGNETWDIYKTDSHGTVMAKLNTSQEPLAMNSQATAVNDLSSVVVEGTVSLDDVALALGTTTAATDSFDELRPCTEAAQAADEWILGAVPNHSYGAGDNTLDVGDLLANELKIGLTNGDMIRFFGQEGFERYVLSGGEWSRDSAIGPLPAAKTPDSGAVMWRKYASAPPARVTFFSETFNPDVIETESYTHNPSVTVRGTDNAGWTASRWTATSAPTPAAAGLNPGSGANECPEGSELFQISEDSPTYKRATSVGGSWAGDVSNFSKNDTIWIKLNKTADITWTVAE